MCFYCVIKITSPTTSSRNSVASWSSKKKLLWTRPQESYLFMVQWTNTATLLELVVVFNSHEKSKTNLSTAREEANGILILGWSTGARLYSPAYNEQGPLHSAASPEIGGITGRSPKYNLLKIPVWCLPFCRVSLMTSRSDSFWMTTAPLLPIYQLINPHLKQSIPNVPSLQ